MESTTIKHKVEMDRDIRSKTKEGTLNEPKIWLIQKSRLQSLKYYFKGSKKKNLDLSIVT
jgi:hypothetical protein